jgi:hypothetical protein
MAQRFLTNISLEDNQIESFRIHNLTTDPSTSAGGKIYFNSSSGKLRFYNGTSWVDLDDQAGGSGVTSLAGTSPIQVSASTGDITVSILAASGSNAGSMSSTHFTRVENATSANTSGTLVLRDGSGNFTAGTITANLTGTASNATNLDSQNGAYYLSRTNHTGTQLASTISNFDTQVRTSRLDQMAAPTASVSFNSQLITNLADPVSPSDAANKAYVDASRSGLDAKESVRVATTGSITLSGTQTIDGVAVIAGDRVLVKNQGTASQNGIYVVAAGAWARASDADSNDEVNSGMFTFVEEGTANDNTGWVLATNNPITLNTTALSFVKFSSQGEILAGNGLTKTGNTLNVGGTADRITVGADSVDIASTYAGQSTIVTLGTVTTGTWSATTIAANRGGTGISSYTTGNYINAASASTLQQRTPAQVLSDIGAVAANAAITGGTATKITYDAKGLVTAGTTLIASDIPSLDADKITTGTFDIARIPTITVAKGGTGLTSVTTNSYLKGNGTGNLVQRTYAEVKTDLSLNNVENVALSTWAGSTSITTLGTIATGTWSGTTIAIARGGTGATTEAGAKTNLGFMTRHVANVGNNSATEFTVTHNFGTRDVVVEVYDNATPYDRVFPEVEHETTNAVKLRFSVAPTTDEFRVVVIG